MKTAPASFYQLYALEILKELEKEVEHITDA